MLFNSVKLLILFTQLALETGQHTQMREKPITISCHVPMLLCLWFVIGLQAWAQDPVIDSLKKQLKSATHDTVRGIILNSLTELASEEEWPFYNDELKKLAENNLPLAKSARERKIYLTFQAIALSNLGLLASGKNEIEAAKKFHEQSIEICEQINYQKGIGFCLGELGTLELKQFNMKEALDYYQQSIAIKNDLKDYKGTALTLNNMGYIYKSLGNTARALDCYFQALNLQEKTNDLIGMAYANSNIGGIHHSQGDLNTALAYFLKSLKLNEEINNGIGVRATYLNLGTIYLQLADYEKAEECYKKSLLLAEMLNDKKGQALFYSHVGSIYKIKKEPNKAIEFYQKGVKMLEELKMYDDLSSALNNMAVSYMDLGNYDKAEQLADKSMKYALQIGFPKTIGAVARIQKLVNEKSGNYKKALEMYELEIKMRDSVNNETSRKANMRSELKYEFEKKSAADSVAHSKESEIKNAELAKQKAEISAKNNQQYALFGGLGLVMIFAGFMYNRFKVTQKQKSIIESQKTEVECQKYLVEEKQKEILDSIQYARRIQMAQIPSEKQVAKSLEKLRIN